LAYRDDIQALNPDHHWIFDGDVLDAVGTADGTISGAITTGTVQSLDATTSMATQATSHYVEVPSLATINSAARDRFAFGGWYSPTEIQDPPCSIWSQGPTNIGANIVLGFGNNVIFEAWNSGTFGLQVFTDRVLRSDYDRPYHLFMLFEGNGFGNRFDAYLDGVKLQDRVGGTPDTASMPGFTNGANRFGSANTGSVGGTGVILTAAVNGRYNHWASFTGANAVISDTDIRVELFEKGALADQTISSDTEANMQTALDAFSATTRRDYPCCIEIEAVSGGGDFTLDLDDITFDDKASIHVRYNGTSGTLTLRNVNGSNCSIVSSPFGGTVVLVTEVTITINVEDAATGADIENARVLVTADTGGPLAVDTVIVDKILTNSSGVVTQTFDYQSNQPVVGVVRKASSSPLYSENSFASSITSAGLNQTVFLVRDE
jgi:hypothetical protein